MKILIPTLRSDLIGGKETFARDLALGLERHGHLAVVLSREHPYAGRAMADDGVRVCTDWDDIDFVPDIVHGQYPIDILVALTRYPDTAGVSSPWRRRLQFTPTASTHLSVRNDDGVLANRLSVEMGLSRRSFVVAQNTADLSRFARVRERPSRLSKALFYNSYHQPGSQTFEAVRAASERCALELDCVGRPFGNRIESPEVILPDYDLVFACGLSAIEALCCGCSVIVLGMTSCGEMVRPENFTRFRAANFAGPLQRVAAGGRGHRRSHRGL